MSIRNQQPRSSRRNTIKNHRKRRNITSTPNPTNPKHPMSITHQRVTPPPHPLANQTKPCFTTNARNRVGGTQEPQRPKHAPASHRCHLRQREPTPSGNGTPVRHTTEHRPLTGTNDGGNTGNAHTPHPPRWPRGGLHPKQNGTRATGSGQQPHTPTTPPPTKPSTHTKPPHTTPQTSAVAGREVREPLAIGPPGRAAVAARPLNVQA